VRTMIPYSNVCDAPSAAVPLSYITNAHVGLDGAYMGSDMDEMSIAFVAQVSSWFNKGDWSTSGSVGTALWTLDLDPGLYYSTFTDGTVSTVNMTPICFLDDLFSYWRGSLKFKFIIAKTKFHSGRLLVSVVYTDPDVSSVIAYTMSNSSYSTKVIVDIREVDEFEVTVPYVSVAPWNRGSIGKLYIHILDPLVAPSVVSSTVTIHGCVRGGEDIAFCGTPYEGSTTQSLHFVVPSAYQMDASCVHSDVTVGNAKVIDKSAEARKATLGEPILSLRQLLKRLCPVMPDNLISAGNITSINVNACGYGTSNGTTVSIYANSLTYDVFSRFNAVYALRRGGTRIAFLPSKGNIGAYFATVKPIVRSIAPTKIYNAVAGTINTLLLAGKNTAQHTFDISNPHSEIQVPQTSRTTNVCNANNCVTSASSTNDPGIDAMQLQTSTPTGSTLTTIMLRAGADDCSFGCFVSIPPMYLYTVPT